jgi:hypothetical protein
VRASAATATQITATCPSTVGSITPPLILKASGFAICEGSLDRWRRQHQGSSS